MREIPDGVISMMVTPMYEDEEINYEALYQEMEWCAQNGARGVVVTPSIGEFATLREHEREECLEVCADYLKEELPDLFRIAGIAATSTAESMRYAQLALDLGYEAGQMNPPYYWNQSEETLYRHYARVAEVGLPLVVYNNPALSKFDMKPKFMARLAKIPGVIAIKEVKTNRHVELEPLFLEASEANPTVKIYTTFRALSTGLVLGAKGAFANVQTTPFCAKMCQLWYEFMYKPISTTGMGILPVENRLRAFRSMEEIQNTMNRVFPRGGEANPYHIATTKKYAELVTDIKMGNAREPDAFPPDFSAEEIKKRLRKELPGLYKLIA